MTVSKKFVHADRPKGPTHPKVKLWNNSGNFCPIKLKFGTQVVIMYLHATATFCKDTTIFSMTNPTYQKVAYSKISKIL